MEDYFWTRENAGMLYLEQPKDEQHILLTSSFVFNGFAIGNSICIVSALRLLDIQSGYAV